jgi:hypothetical protein
MMDYFQNFVIKKKKLCFGITHIATSTWKCYVVMFNSNYQSGHGHSTEHDHIPLASEECNDWFQRISFSIMLVKNFPLFEMTYIAQSNWKCYVVMFNGGSEWWLH